MLEERLRSHAEQTPDLVTMRTKRDGAYVEWTCSQVWAQARSVAAALRECGVQPQDRAALFADNSPEWVLAYLGIYLAGAIVVPLDAQYTERELSTILGFARCRVMLCAESTRERAENARADAHIQELLSIDPGAPIFAAAQLDRPAARQSRELMAVIFTSGTTGDPKGVCLSVGNVTSNVQSLLVLGILGERDTLLSLLPLHHCYALTTTVLVPLACGGAITFCDSLRGPDILDAMRETGVTVVPGVPKLFEGFDRAIHEKVRKAAAWKQRLFGLLKKLSRKIRRITGLNPGRLLFRSIHRAFGKRFRFFASGGARLDPSVADRLLDLGIKVIEGYGLTETSPVLTFNPVNRPRPGSVGMPIPGVELKIADPDADSVGEVIVRGPNVMQGYDRKPEETAEVLCDGCFHTGDLGFIDAQGYLHLTGRAKEVIVLASGKNVYPEDVEAHYDKSPLVAEVCVMPVEQPDGRVERLRAVVVPAFDELRRRKATSAHHAIRQSLAALAQGVPSYMRLTALKLVSNELPRTRLGKLRRAEIRAMAFDEVKADAPVALSAKDQALLARSGADELIARVRAISGFEGEIVPGDHLELDLGLDSLARIELDVALERDFGVRIPREQLAEVNTVGDLIERLATAGEASLAPGGWRELLSRPESPRLTELFNLERGPVARWAMDTPRRFARRVSERAFPLDVRAVERLPRDRPFLLCPSHASFIDPVLIGVCLPDDVSERMFYLGAQEFFDSALMRWAARVGRVIPTATADTVLASMRRAAEALRMGRSVCVFPEGHITRDGFLQRPRPGASILACETGVPIVPLLVRGTYDIMSYAHPGFRFRAVGLTFGEPIPPPAKREFNQDDYAALMTEWGATIIRLRREDDASGSRTAGRSPRIPEERPERE